MRKESYILENISEMENSEKTNLYKFVKNRYLEHNKELDEIDIINIKQIQLFAEQEGRTEWEKEMEKLINNRFKDFSDSTLLINGESSFTDPITPSKARELVKEHENWMENLAKEEAFTPQKRKNLIEEAQIGYIHLILNDIKL